MSQRPEQKVHLYHPTLCLRCNALSRKIVPMPWETIWNIVLGIFAFLGGVWTLLRVRDYLWSKASLVATITPHKSHYLQHFGRDVDDL